MHGLMVKSLICTDLLLACISINKWWIQWVLHASILTLVYIRYYHFMMLVSYKVSLHSTSKCSPVSGVLPWPHAGRTAEKPHLAIAPTQPQTWGLLEQFLTWPVEILSSFSPSHYWFCLVTIRIIPLVMVNYVHMTDKFSCLSLEILAVSGFSKATQKAVHIKLHQTWMQLPSQRSNAAFHSYVGHAKYWNWKIRNNFKCWFWQQKFCSFS